MQSLLLRENACEHCLSVQSHNTGGPGSSASFGAEIEDTAGGRDPYTRFGAVMLTEQPLTEASLEIWPHRIYDLVMQIRREYSRPILEVNESGCSYLSAP